MFSLAVEKKKEEEALVSPVAFTKSPEGMSFHAFLLFVVYLGPMSCDQINSGSN